MVVLRTPGDTKSGHVPRVIGGPAPDRPPATRPAGGAASCVDFQAKPGGGGAVAKTRSPLGGVACTHERVQVALHHEQDPLQGDVQAPNFERQLPPVLAGFARGTV